MKNMFIWNQLVQALSYVTFVLNDNLIVSACAGGSYGVECNKTCGHCRDINQCYHINGTCLTGCDAGYQGNLCKTRKET